MNEQVYEKAAKTLGVDIPSIKAVASVESNGGGFAQGAGGINVPKILFEGHVFHRLTEGKYSKDHPTISYPKWIKAHYSKTNQGEYKRLEAASALDRDAALQSASWGMFQIMGFNYKQAGYTSVQDFVKAMYASEDEQLMAFVNFIKSQKLDSKLQARDWAGFAKAYNGPGYAANQYDKKLADAYKRFSEN